MYLFKRLRFLGLSFVTFVFFLTGCADISAPPVPRPAHEAKQSQPKDLKTIKIGAILPMSGSASAYGVEGMRVLAYRVNDLNSQSEKNGYKVEILYEDGQCEEKVAAAALKKLVDTEGVRFILGGGCSSESLGIAPLLIEKGAVALTSTSSSPDIEGKSVNLFSLSYSDALVGDQIAAQLAKFNKVALITEQNDYSRALKTVVEKVLKTKYPAVKIVANVEFPIGTTDFKTFLEKLKNSGADAVFLNPNVGLTAESLLKEILGMKEWKPQFVSHFAYLNDKTLSVAPKAAEGMIVVDAPSIVDPKFVEYKDKIIAANGTLDHLGSFYTATTLDAFDIFVRLVVQYDGDASAVQKALSTSAFDSEWGGGKFMFGGKTFVQRAALAYYRVKSGRPELLP